MNYTNLSNDELILLAENSFKKEQYKKCYNICTELIRTKAPSVVVYMHCVSMLNISKQNKEWLDKQIDNSLLVITALDKFYKSNDIKNEKIKEYIADILISLLMLNIESALSNIKSKTSFRSYKTYRSTMAVTESNYLKLQDFDFSSFEILLPPLLVQFKDDVSSSLLDFLDFSIDEDAGQREEAILNLNDVYERILNFKNQIAQVGIDQVDNTQPYSESADDVYENELEAQSMDFEEENDLNDDYAIFESLKSKSSENIRKITKSHDNVIHDELLNADADASYFNKTKKPAEQEKDKPQSATQYDFSIFKSLKNEALNLDSDKVSDDFLDGNTDNQNTAAKDEAGEFSFDMLDEKTPTLSKKFKLNPVKPRPVKKDPVVAKVDDEIVIKSAVDIQQIQDEIYDMEFVDESEYDDVYDSDFIPVQKKPKRRIKAIDVIIVVISIIITVLTIALIFFVLKPEMVYDLLDKILY
jgi:hypothetical protein